MSSLPENILTKFNRLPAELKQEAADFVEFLMLKHENQIQNQSRKKPQFGSCKGLFVIPDDFDEPLKDFNSYMK